MSPIRWRALLAPGVVFVACLVPLAVGEVVLRLLPVYSAFDGYAPDSVYRFAPGKVYTYSRGWRFQDARRIHTNRQGWVSPVDYDSTDRSPLMAIVGDSYVEALMVPFDSSIGGRLGRLERTYTFGVSGAPLSQYLVEARAAKRYYPSMLAVVVVGNDFDESVSRYRVTGRPFFVFDDDRDSLRTPTVEAPSRIRVLLRHSALARYFMLNVQLAPRIAALRSPRQFAGNTASDTNSARVRASQRAIRLFLERLPTASGLLPDQIVFLLDGIRPITDAPPPVSYFSLMRRAFTDSARARGFEVVDLMPAFIARRSEGPFEFVDDGHWNAAGHRIASDALRASATYRHAFEQFAGTR